MRYDEEKTIEQLHADASQLQARAEKAEQKCSELAAAQIRFCHCIFTGVNPQVTPYIEHCVIRTMEADAAYRAQIERETLERVWNKFPPVSEASDNENDIRMSIVAEFAPKGVVKESLTTEPCSLCGGRKTIKGYSEQMMSIMNSVFTDGQCHFPEEDLPCPLCAPKGETA